MMDALCVALRYLEPTEFSVLQMRCGQADLDIQRGQIPGRERVTRCSGLVPVGLLVEVHKFLHPQERTGLHDL